MYIRFLIVLSLNSFFIPSTVFAQDALSSVQIVEGINQQRPLTTRQTIGRRYVWNFRGKHYTVLMTIDLERYNSYSANERKDIPELVEEGRKAIGNLTREFQNTFRRYPNWTNQDRVDFVLSFVQSLPYTLDDVTTGYDEFRRYAVETLIEGGGDCEDTTILVAAILRGLGESTALIFTPGHIALGVSGNFTGTSVSYSGKKYYYCETTGTGWTVGMLPKSTRGTIEAIVPLTPSPIGPAPKPKRTTPTLPVQLTPATEVIDPTPKTPPIEPEPKTPKPQTQVTANKTNGLGTVIATFFILAGIGIPLVYILYRSLRNEIDENSQNYDEPINGTDSSPKNPLDQ